MSGRRNVAHAVGAASPGASRNAPSQDTLPQERSQDASQPADAAARLRRVFFALWPDDATRGAIERSCRRVVRLSGGRATAKRNLHVTVAFLGSVDATALELAAGVPPLPVGPVELCLDRLGYFAEARTLWLGPTQVPPALTDLEQSLWAGLEQVGFEREQRIYRPHVTLARRARAVDEPLTPVTWTASALTLVESISLARGVHYEPLREWPLTQQ